MENKMSIQLNEKVARMVTELANSMGLSPDDLVAKIVEWYFEDCRKEK